MSEPKPNKPRQRGQKDDQEYAVDETDDGPDAAPGDIGEGPDSPPRKD